MQLTSAIGIFAVLSKCGFHHNHCQSQSQPFVFLQPVSFEELWRILI